ncbi:unnamed protein product [Peronospora belbahrii]|uniref:Ig-like domain-containing protein n=1 Tax=Peronospora belbahrii TaxID=622444 RepID=A0ABN8CV57_9STRA|nr:unnamed protein product [Peronospora belbahrii]
MKRRADIINGGDSGYRDCNSIQSTNERDYKRMHYVEERTNDIGIAIATVKTLADEKETDPHRLAQRQKQIDYGKNTIGYDRYCAQVPRRQRHPKQHPMTPDKTMRIGKKGFDGIIRKWRQALHKYDPPELAEATKAMTTDNQNIVTGDAVAKNVNGGATKSVKLKEGAAMTSACAATTTLSKSDEKTAIDWSRRGPNNELSPSIHW